MLSIIVNCAHSLIKTASASSVLLRQKIVKKCREDIYQFLNEENGQIAIYDAVNPLPSGRRSLANEFAKHDIEVCVSWRTVVRSTNRSPILFLRHYSLNRGAMTNVSLRRMFAE